MKKRNVFILAAACTLCWLKVYAQGGDMQITSPEFAHNESIPGLFTCQGDDVNPALEISGVPEDARTLVLIMDDPDAPGVTWDHWIVWNIPAGTVGIEQDSVPGEQGRNSWGRRDYGGPCPPSGTHRYFFKLYALDTELSLSAGASKQELEQAMQGHILAQAELIGLYKKE
ncbi:MAG: YbhB/YbcL family Raf kinase inhibitor-like protein [Candidatus Omnitrophica bacterium]|nr:YbhB/YbcL family Raf kinase inhibitor-like protein [Candidatus Omnitrophota bacterium]